MKRIISSLLAIILLLGVHCVSAQSVQAADKDTVALKFLDALGVLPENFDASQEMTRAEFVDFVITAMKLDGAGSVDTSYFLDVDQSHPYYDSISVASQQGLIQGDEFSLFRPDRIITFEDAVKIATSAIGYAPVAITRGGYAIGYMVVAEQNDLLEHLNSDNTSGNLAGLVYNMLCAPMLSVKSMDADSVKYANSEDDTILSHYWKILKRKGYVTEVGFSTYTGPSTLSAEKVRLDDEVFLVGNTDVEQYFGCNVTYFYEDSDNAGLKKLVYLYPSKAIQEEVILAEDIIDVDLADSNIEYYANGNNKRTNFSKTPYVIYNGVALSNYSREDLKPEYGSIRLMDGDNDGEYEFLFISDMEYVQVGYIDLDKQLICEKTTNRTFELEDAYVKITKDDTTIPLDEVKELNILSICESKDKKRYTINVSDKTVNGTVTLLTDDSAVIGDKEYKIYSKMDKQLNVGQKVVLYLSADEIIAAAELSNTNRYGYLCAVDSNSGGVDNRYTLKLVTQAGSTALFNLANKVTYNNDPPVSKEAAFSNIEAYCRSGGTRIVEYKTNPAGEISKIKTAASNLNAESDYDEKEFTLDYDSGNDSVRYYKRMFGGTKLLTADCIVWKAPAPDENYQVDDEKVFVTSPGSFEDGTSYKNIRLFNYNEYMAATMCEYIGDVSEALEYTATAFIVDEVRKVLLGDGEDGVMLSGYRDGQYKTLTFDSDSKLKTNQASANVTQISNPANLKKGDVIQAAVSSDRVKVYRVLYNTADRFGDRICYSVGGAYKEYPTLEVALGRMEFISDDSMIIDISGEKYLYFTNNTDVIFISNNKISKGSIHEIQTQKHTGNGAKVLIHAVRKQAQEIVIYE